MLRFFSLAGLHNGLLFAFPYGSCILCIRFYQFALCSKNYTFKKSWNQCAYCLFPCHLSFPTCSSGVLRGSLVGYLPEHPCHAKEGASAFLTFRLIAFCFYLSASFPCLVLFCSLLQFWDHMCHHKNSMLLSLTFSRFQGPWSGLLVWADTALTLGTECSPALFFKSLFRRVGCSRNGSIFPAPFLSVTQMIVQACIYASASTDLSSQHLF